MTLDAKCEARVQYWLTQAGPLSEKQKDVIAAAFHGALQPKRTGGGDRAT